MSEHRQPRGHIVEAESNCHRLALYTPDTLLSMTRWFTFFDLRFTYLNSSVTAPTFKDMLHVLLTVIASKNQSESLQFAVHIAFAF